MKNKADQIEKLDRLGVQNRPDRVKFTTYELIGQEMDQPRATHDNDGMRVNWNGKEDWTILHR